MSSGTRRRSATTAERRPVGQPGERADDQEQDPVASGGDGVLHFSPGSPPDTMAAMHPRTRDFVGAAILTLVLVLLLVYVVSLGAQGT